MDILITVKDLQEKYAISRSTIDRWRKEGMPFTKVGRGVRFESVKVEKWLEENKQMRD